MNNRALLMLGWANEKKSLNETKVIVNKRVKNNYNVCFDRDVDSRKRCAVVNVLFDINTPVCHTILGIDNWSSFSKRNKVSRVVFVIALKEPIEWNNLQIVWYNQNGLIKIKYLDGQVNIQWCINQLIKSSHCFFIHKFENHVSFFFSTNSELLGH